MNIRLLALVASLGVPVFLGACESAPPPATPAAAPPAATASAGPLAESPPASAPATSPSAPPSPAIQAAVGAADRSDDDRKLDAGRHPAETLAFFGIAPGMHVAELAAGTGYTTELLARAVGPGGAVYAENPKVFLSGYVGKPWGERLAKPALKNVVRADRELDDPLPPEAKDLDAVLFILTYHDAVWMGPDRQKMNAAVFAALKHGGVYGIVDHSAKAGAGLNDVKTVHRIEESTLKQEVEKAGFRLDAEADFLRNPSDTRDWSASPKVAGERRGTSDRFVLRFVKP